MKTKVQIFREAEKMTQDRVGKEMKYALYSHLCFVAGLLTKEELKNGNYSDDFLSQRIELFDEYSYYVQNRSDFQRAIEDLLDEEGQT